MILLSAQPDTNYFLWQLEVQLKNFASFGIRKDSIHILFGYDPCTDINPNCLQFIEEHIDLACFFVYPDTRISKHYISSIRPNIIKQHFNQFPDLSAECIFYNDSDIVFTNKLPDFDRMCSGDTWYLSDARGYLNSAYINSFGDNILDDMCQVMQIDKEMVLKNDHHAGGAQYLMKNLSFSFWDDVERDSEKLFEHLIRNKNRYSLEFEKKTGRPHSEYKEIQAWCSDMWALLWNGFRSYDIKIDQELNFCWPKYDITEWDKNMIFHNAGISHFERDLHFYKSDYKEVDPYSSFLGFVSSATCGYKYIKMVEDVGRQKKYTISNATFILFLRADGEETINILKSTLFFLKQNFQTNIMVAEIGNFQKIIKEDLPDSIIYTFIESHEDDIRAGENLNEIIRHVKTDIIINYEPGVILPPDQIYKGVTALRYNRCAVNYPFSTNLLLVPEPFRSFFIKNNDIRFLVKHVQKFIPIPNTLFRGCNIVFKEKFLEIEGFNNVVNDPATLGQLFDKKIRLLRVQSRREAGLVFLLKDISGNLKHPLSYQKAIVDHQEFLRMANLSREEYIVDPLEEISLF